MVAHRILISLSKKKFRFRRKMFVTAIDEIDNMWTSTFRKILEKHI